MHPVEPGQIRRGLDGSLLDGEIILILGSIVIKDMYGFETLSHKYLSNGKIRDSFDHTIVTYTELINGAG